MMICDESYDARCFCSQAGKYIWEEKREDEEAEYNIAGSLFEKNAFIRDDVHCLASDRILFSVYPTFVCVFIATIIIVIVIVYLTVCLSEYNKIKRWDIKVHLVIATQQKHTHTNTMSRNRRDKERNKSNECPLHYRQTLGLLSCSHNYLSVNAHTHTSIT